ncbi:type VI secretion system baseplate subunit TssG [Maridesulfovibrio sp.]|uniref:type VI secretion system baseplate subunit TssG n=1 Tax=Maridesulfovibrio sp. TaxID=2795000 RepID=UPI0029C9FEB9|nr:type VI secretion system baseplate subunit TssG [Maridesulfovibrio sp.]
MDCDDREPSASVTGNLFVKPTGYSFFQAIRLLRLHSHNCTGKDLEAFFRDHLRVRPQLSLGFPATDLTDLEQEEKEDGDLYHLVTTFLGLYGASSPLPVFYTEELLAEAAEDKTVTRDFLDIINNNAYSQFFRAWSRSRLMIKAVDEKDGSWLERLDSLLGYGHAEAFSHVPPECRRYRHIGLLTQYPRSALGLETLLKDSLEHTDIEVEQCVMRKVKIPEDQRFYLGHDSNVLGERSWIGEELKDRNSKLAVHLSNLNSGHFHQLLPGAVDGDKLDNLVRGYLVEPFKYDLVLEMTSGEANTAVLGGEEWSSLGCDTWVFSGEHLEHAKASFPNKGGHIHERYGA